MAHIKRSSFSGTPYVKCITCGYKGKGKRHSPGSTFTELLMWICFIIPGIMYSNRRRKASGYICKQCGNHNVIKITKKEANEKEEQSLGDKYDQLQKLTELKEKGTITEEEFLIEKEKIMS